MKSLQIRETPNELYEIVANKAKAEGRSISQQALVLLAKGVEVSLDSAHKRKKALQDFIPFRVKSFDVVAEIRKDRKR